MFRLPAIALCCLVLSACDRPDTLLGRIQANNELIIVTRNAATTYYEGPQGSTGLEYDLARLFAQHLKVNLRVEVPRDFSSILQMVENGEAHIAAAGLTDTAERRTRVRFGPSYQTILPQFIYRTNGRDAAPKDLDNLHGKIEVIAGSSHEERLRTLLLKHPKLSWKSHDTQDIAELLRKVWDKEIDYTVADSNDVAIHQRFFPELRVAFDINTPEHLAWAFAKGPDDSLYQEAEKFFAKLDANGELNRILKRHYGYLQNFDYVGTRRYLRHIEERLPDYKESFEVAAMKFNFDWRLLAAVGYQESHWDPAAKSPTGVRGLMMLTRDTLRHLGMKNRTDPVQSIEGGARYLRQINKRLPAQIVEPDRTWMALAAYNVGFGHVMDARKLAEKNGRNPNKWGSVKATLPLLTERRWYTQTSHGYARGYEPVKYVENIRSYYDILVWNSDRVSELASDAETVSDELL